MESIVREKANSDQLIKLYQSVQNIPFGYSLPRDPDLVIKKNRGVCSEKNLYLAKQFRSLGVPIQFIIVRFNWNDIPIPKELISKRKNLLDWHLILKIRPANKWIYVDATWNPQLASQGFPVTVRWDGLSDTKFGVHPLWTIAVPFFAYWFLKQLVKMRGNDEPQFQSAFNQYLRRFNDF